MLGTRERILNAAEDLFGQRGYVATPLEDIASVVGVRASAIFKHFPGKWALYQSVTDRLLSDYVEFVKDSDIAKDPIAATTRAFKYSLDHPNLARLLQHAALRDGEALDYIATKWLAPFIAHINRAHTDHHVLRTSSLFSNMDIYLAFNNMIYGFITMGSFNSRVYGVDFTSKAAQDQQLALLVKLAGALINDQDDLSAGA